MNKCDGCGKPSDRLEAFNGEMLCELCREKEEGLIKDLQGDS